MCFSASASFIAGSALTVAGVVSVSQVRKPKQFVFAVVPFFFGIQQFCEGFLWLSLTGNGFAESTNLIKFIFLLFAHVLWPFYVPLAVLAIEENEKRKKIMRYFVFGGIIVSALLLWRLIFYNSYAQINGCHIHYEVMTPDWVQIFTSILYVSAIVITPFFLSLKYGKILAFTNLAGLVVTLLFYTEWLVSVWCFFAAVQSVVIIIIMFGLKRNHKKQHLP